jgi:hypothetical protein
MGGWQSGGTMGAESTGCQEIAMAKATLPTNKQLRLAKATVPLEYWLNVQETVFLAFSQRKNPVPLE